EIQRRASELKTRVAPPLPPAIRAEMRPYQTEGFHFLAYLASNGFGGVLADDMGLGKTLQTLAWLASTPPKPFDGVLADDMGLGKTLQTLAWLAWLRETTLD